MIRKETIKKTRDFLNAAKRTLPTINKGYISPQEVAYCHDVSRARFVAAVDLGFFETVGRRGRGFIYKSNYPYFNEDMAAAVIRHEYNMYAPKEIKSTPSTPDEIREDMKEDAKRGFSEKTLEMVTDWLRINSFEGVLYKLPTAFDEGIKVVL